MNKNADILKELNKRPYGTPDGYFEYLEMRLTDIPNKAVVETKKTRTGFFVKLSPYLALAAVFAVALVLGNLILKTPQVDQVEYLSYEELLYADMISETYPFFYESEEYMTEYGEVSQEDVINYLIESNTSLEVIAYNYEYYE